MSGYLIILRKVVEKPPGFLRKRLKVEMRKGQVASVVGFGKWASQVTLVSEESTCPSRSRLRST